MRSLFRPRLWLWLLGVAVLVGTAAGANQILNHTRASSDDAAPAALPVTVPFDGEGIVAFGYVDVETRVARLYPTRPGRVVWVAAEGDKVAAGEPLLKVDDRLARKVVEEARLALQGAEAALTEANLLPKQRDEQVKQLQASLKSLQHKKEAARQQELHVQALLSAGQGSQYTVRGAQEQVKEIDSLIEAQTAKLAELKLADPQLSIRKAELDVQHKKAQLEKAELGLDEFAIKAPKDGTVLRCYVSVGEVLGPSPTLPALEFCPEGPRVIRAEIQQEWAARLAAGQEAVIEDDTTAGLRWRGRVKSVSDWFTQRRSIIQEPFQFNDVRTMEAIVEVTDTDAPPLRIGQRMRVLIRQGGP